MRSTAKIIAAIITLLVIIAACLWTPITYSEKIALSIFIFAVGFWAFEIIPLYATSLLIVIFLTLLLAIPHFSPMQPHPHFSYFLIPFSSPVIMLFFGGFVLAKALQKHHIDEYIVVKLLNRVRNSPAKLMILTTFNSAFLSMWISNTASAAMMLMLIQPILTQLDSEDPFKKGLVLSIAFGANTGGILTPIGTPPNAIAMGILNEVSLNIDFFQWMILSLPIGIILLITVSVILFVLFRPKSNLSSQKLDLPKLSWKAQATLLIMVIVVILWLTTGLHHISESIIALVAVGLLASCKLITKEDLRSINWDILILMWGGLALGEGLQVTHLSHRLMNIGFFEFHPLMTIALFAIVAIALSSFISNTATANILLPIVIGIPFIHPQLLVITTALSCSFAYAFPISTPPNAIAYSTNTIKISDMVKSGLCLSALGFILLLIGKNYIDWIV